MRRITEVLEGLLVRDGMSAGSGGTDDAHGIDAGERRGMAAHPAIGRREGGQTGPMGMGKRTPTEAGASHQEVVKRQVKLGRSGDSFLWLIADNVDVVPTGKRAMPAPFPVCIEGGKL